MFGVSSPNRKVGFQERERKRTSKNAFVQISICCSPKLVRLVHIVQLLCSFFILFDRAFLVHNEEKYVCIVFFFDLLMSVVYVMHFPTNETRWSTGWGRAKRSFICVFELLLRSLWDTLSSHLKRIYSKFHAYLDNERCIGILATVCAAAVAIYLQEIGAPYQFKIWAEEMTFYLGSVLVHA